MWGRHTASGDKAWHFIVSVQTGGSVSLRCKGRWPASDEYREDPSPPFHERCRACLFEIVNAPAVNRSGVVDFDCSDVEAE